MTQDIGVPLFEGFYEIYYNPTPVSLVYPGGVEIYWQKFEAEAFSYLGENVPDNIKCGLVSLELISKGDIAYPKESVDLDFELRANGTKILLGSGGWRYWDDFVWNLNHIDRLAEVENDIWQEQLEEQYMVCCLRVLRKLFPKIAGRILVGNEGDSFEEMVNRSSALPRVI